MSIDLRLPHITGTSERQQLEQIKSYLFQMGEQMTWALNALDREGVLAVGGQGHASHPGTTGAPGGGSSGKTGSKSDFSEIKALIISSSDIVNAYYEQINRRLVGRYEALSDYGSFKEETELAISQNASAIDANFQHVQKVITADGGETVYVSANIKAGLLAMEDGVPIYGLEVGQKNGGNFRKYARFTSGRLSFFDANDTEVAWISDMTLHIASAEILVSLKLGGYRYLIGSEGDVIHKWYGV